MNIALDEAALPPLLDRFYECVRHDAELGPVFNGAVQDWPVHLKRLAEFWSSVMLTSGRYKGNPMALHLKHASSLTTSMFERWLALWRQTTDEMLTPSAAAAMQAKAKRIAENLMLALQLGTRAPPPQDTPVQRSLPYRSTPVFDATTLPKALQRAHSTRAGVWGVIRVLEGSLRYCVEGTGASELLSPNVPGYIRPEELHHVEPLGPMRMQVEFYDHQPQIG